MAKPKGSEDTHETNSPTTMKSAEGNCAQCTGVVEFLLVFPSAMPPLTAPDVLMFLLILLAIMGAVVLYHLLFLVTDVRRILKRVNDLVEKVEETVLKPITIMDRVLNSIIDLFDGKKKHKADFNKRNIK